MGGEFEMLRVTSNKAVLNEVSRSKYSNVDSSKGYSRKKQYRTVLIERINILTHVRGLEVIVSSSVKGSLVRLGFID
jgi:hypothetical protein